MAEIKITKNKETILAKKRAIILLVAFMSFFTLGMHNGAFTIGWVGISDEWGLALSYTGPLIMVMMFMFSLSSSMLGRLQRYLWIERIDFLGTVALAVALVVVALSQNFAMLIFAFALIGIGSGMIESSINAYMTECFTARHSNWSYLVWGVGATISPLIMSQSMLRSSWRMGYFILAFLIGAVSVFVIASSLKGVWKKNEPLETHGEEKSISWNFLSKTRHKVGALATCFIYGGLDYSLVFFTTAIMLERGVSLETVALFPSVYYFCVMGGRMIFGWLAKWLSDTATIRIGLGIALVGVAVLMLSSSLIGMGLAGFGIAPVFPTLMHDTSNRFSPKTLAKQVGYEVAACGSGMAILFFLMGVVLEQTSMEMLYPISVAFIVIIFVLNEVLEYALKAHNSVGSTEKSHASR